MAINVDLNLKVVKNIKDAQLTFSIAQNAEEAVYFIDKVKDVNTNYPYSQKTAREVIWQNLKRKGIEINLHQTNFGLICNKFNLKNNEDYFYYHSLTKKIWLFSKTNRFYISTYY